MHTEASNRPRDVQSRESSSTLKPLGLVLIVGVWRVTRSPNIACSAGFSTFVAVMVASTSTSEDMPVRCQAAHTRACLLCGMSDLVKLLLTSLKDLVGLHSCEGVGSIPPIARFRVPGWAGIEGVVSAISKCPCWLSWLSLISE